MFRPNQALKNFKAFVVEAKEAIEAYETQEEIAEFLEKKSKEMLDADHVVLWYRLDETAYYAPASQHTHRIDVKTTSIFKEVIQKHQPLLIKDAQTSLLYNAAYDNVVKENSPKDILLVPVELNKHDQEPPAALVWAATHADSHRNLTQKQTLYYIKFLEALKQHIIQAGLSEKESLDITLEQCLEQNETYEALMERNKRYFHSIIHDVRTPMNALLGFLELLSLNEEDLTKKDYLHSALKSGEHIVRLINDALDVAKIESGELPVEKKPFDIHTELEDTIKIFFESAGKKNIQLCAFIDPLIPQCVTSDAYRIKQVLSNLLSNAIKFTPEEGSILVEAVYNADDDTVTVAVEDTGKGIKKEALGSIFAAYRQEDASTERQYGGTGLGLNISYQIVALLGGQLEVQSEVGKGSRFCFTLPALSDSQTKPLCTPGTIHDPVRLYRWKGREDLRAKTVVRYLERFGVTYTQEAQETSLQEIYRGAFTTNEIFIIEKDRIFEDDYEYAQLLLDKGCRIIWLEDVFDIIFNYFKGDIKKLTYPVLTKAFYEALRFTKEKQDDLKATIEKIDFAGKKVLVVDDNRINLKFMEAILSKLRINITSFDDAQSALDALQNESYDLLFIDENMPKMLGSEAIRIIKERINHGDISPLALISLSGDSHHKDLILQAGADEVMTKPVKLDELYAVLQKYLADNA